ncbi:MAG: thioredoxin domain-containing protein [Mobilitalea sp.]
MAVRVNKGNFDKEVLKAQLPVLVEFYSDSCVPCKQLAPILGDLEEEYEDLIRIVKVNVNFDVTLADTYQVAASPTILFFRNGQEQQRIRGIVKKNELEDIIKAIL